MKEGQGFSLASGAGHPAASHRGMRGTARLHFWGVRQGTEGTAHSAALGVQDGKYVPIVASKESLNVSGKTERKEKGGEKRQGTFQLHRRRSGLRPFGSIHLDTGRGQHESPGSS